ncbi:hypothetical protein BJV82DRAFT_674979 [Fennellomyces sp. T-0311]|nr:hypothetical protein BJV82DRAFT_674979 [Fennellomyces sp. T-0311]
MSNNSNDLQMGDFEETRARQASRAARSLNQWRNDMADENASLRARLEQTEKRMKRMGTLLASCLGADGAGLAASVPKKLTDAQLRAKYGKKQKEIVTNYVHERVAAFPDGFDFRFEYRVSPNKEFRNDVVQWISVQPGSVKDNDYIDVILKAYYHTLRRKWKVTVAKANAILQRKRRTTRVTNKLEARKRARLDHASALEQEYPAGETVLVRECMSPELSDREDGVEVMRVLTPGFRTPKAKEYIHKLDEYVKATKKRQNRSSNNSSSTGGDDVVMEDAIEEDLVFVVGDVPNRAGNGRGNRSYKRFARRYAVTDSAMSGKLTSTLPDWAL